LSLVGSGTPADVNFVDFPIQVRAPGTYRFFVHIPSGNPASIRAALVVGGVRQAVFTPDNTPSGRSSWLFVDSAPLAANATVSVRLLHPGTQGTALYADAARAVLVPNSEVGVTGYPGWTKTPAGTNRITFAGSGASNELKRSQHDLNGNWNAGAFSTNALLGDGKLRFRFIGDGLQMQAGLTLSAASSDPAHITYRFTNKNSGKVQALGGTSAEFNYVNGDWMEIERVGRQMIFRRNSTFLHAIALAPSAPAYLHVDASLLEENARLFGTQISGHWIHPAWSTNIDYDAFTDSTERPVIDADAEDSLQSIFDVNLSEDLDLDGLTNAQEVANGTLPENPDTDGDGLSDGAEVNTHGTNPTNPDTDNDGLEDGFEVHSVYGFDPTKRFTINDGVSDFTRWEILEFDPNDEFSELADVLAGADFDLDGVNNRHESADGTSAIDRNDWFRPVVFDRLFGDFEGADWTIDQIDGVNSSRLARNAPGDTPAGAVSHHEAIDGTRVRFQFSNLLANSSLADQIAVGFSHRGMDADEAGDFPNYAVSIRPVGAGEARLYFLDSPAPNTSPFTVTPTDLLELRLELTGAAQKLHVEKNQQALVTVDLPPGFLSFDLETNPLAVVTRLGAGSNTVHNLRYRGIYDPDRDEDQMADRWEQRIVDFYPQFTTVEEVFPGGDSDNDTLTNIEEYNRGTDPTNPDTDGDGMPDGWEVAYGLNPKNPTDGTETLNPDGTPAADLDGDGLSNRAEYDFGSRPDRISTALDGFSDAWRQRWNLNPLAALDPGVDADEDGLTNGEEYTLGTNPNVKDSDGDGFEDGWEVANGFDPLYDDRITDSDEDGLLNTDELAAGTDPLNPDSDGDDLKDGDEIHTYLTDPLNPDTDGDGLPDGWEIAGLIMHFGHQFQPGEPIVRNHTYGEWNLMSSVELEPTVDSTPIHQAWERTVFQYDWYYNSTFPVQETLYRTQTRLNDGTIVEPQDGWVHDTVKNTLTRPNQITRWTVEYDENLRLWVGVHQTPEQISTWWWVVTDPLSGDTDEDGLPDGWEYSHWLNPDRTADAGENPDNDGLINSAEFTAGTHPWRADTDGDLLNDGHEVNVSLSNPLDPMDPGTAGGATPPLIPVRPVATRVEILSVQPSPTPGGTLVPRRAPTLSGRGGRAPGGPGAQVPVASTPIAGPLPSNPGAAAQDRPSPPPSGELYLEFRTMDKSLFGPMAELEGGGDPVWNEDLQIWELAGGGGPNPGDPDGDDWFGITRQDIKGINEANESAKTKDEPPARNFLDQAKIDHETDWQKDEAEPLATASVSGKGRHYSTVATEVRLVRKANAASPESYANVQVAVKRQFLKVTRKRPVPPTGSNGGDWTVVKAEKLELTIPVNQSKSVADNQHPLPGNAFEPKMEKDWEYEVILLPVDIEEVISDQIAGNECNKLPTLFFNGEPNNPMLMATGSGQKAKLRVKMASASDPKVYVGGRKTGTQTVLGSASVTANIVPLEFDIPANSHDKYDIVAGYDANANSKLDDSEAVVVFKKTPLTTSKGAAGSDPDGILDKVIIVDQDQFSSSKSTLNTYSNAPGSEYAGDLIGAFGKGSKTVPNSTIAYQITISSREPGLSHPVGAKWNASNQDSTYRFTFADGSPASNNTESSNALKQIVQKVIADNKASMIAAYTGTPEWPVSPYYDFSESKELGKTDPDPWGLSELGFAFGKVTLKGKLRVSYKKTGAASIEVGDVEVIGTFDDLYDFQYQKEEKAKNASMVQAGHATLAPGAEPDSGKIFFTRVEFNTGGFANTWSGTY